MTVTVLKIFFAVSGTSTVPVTTSGATTATLSTTPETSINPVACIPVTTNNISLEEFNVIVEGLKISKSNTSSHKRSLTCAYDPRPSSTAIGGVGIGVICFIFVLLFIMDCTTIMKEDLDHWRKLETLVGILFATKKSYSETIQGIFKASSCSFLSFLLSSSFLCLV